MLNRESSVTDEEIDAMTDEEVDGELENIRLSLKGLSLSELLTELEPLKGSYYKET